MRIPERKKEEETRRDTAGLAGCINKLKPTKPDKTRSMATRGHFKSSTFAYFASRVEKGSKDWQVGIELSKGRLLKCMGAFCPTRRSLALIYCF